MSRWAGRAGAATTAAAAAAAGRGAGRQADSRQGDRRKVEDVEVVMVLKEREYMKYRRIIDEKSE